MNVICIGIEDGSGGGGGGGDGILIRISIETNIICDFSVWGSGLGLLIYFLSYYP